MSCSASAGPAKRMCCAARPGTRGPGPGRRSCAKPACWRRWSGSRGSVFFVLDEFALLPQLSHISTGINFGRSLGLKFIAGTQNVSQVLKAYGAESGASILSGFGTVLAFRLMDDASRDLVRQRFGANRKQITTYAHVRSEGVQQVVVMGNVIEDWVLSGLALGQCIVSLPEGDPFFFAVQEYQPRPGR